MKKIIVISSLILLGIILYTLIPALTKSDKTKLTGTDSPFFPKVLFITSGGPEGNGEISEGISIAIQCFNKNGNFVWLNTREILMQPQLMSNYNIMIIPTSIGYHDADRKYSLTYLSDKEMQNISDWVKNGGTLIAEENIGRNTMEGEDRVNISGELNPQTWKLSETFGVKMRERDLNGFSIEETDVKIWNGKVKEQLSENEWALIPTEIISDKLKVLAEWTNGAEKIPSVIENNFGKGKAFLLTSTYLLHPSNDGGLSGIEQIENFYNYALWKFGAADKPLVELNPWLNGFSNAFCVTFNSLGNLDQFRRITSFLNEEKISATFFIDSSLTTDEQNLLEENKNIFLESNFYNKTDLSEADYSAVSGEILMNEENFGKNFSGIRFPFRSTNYWGLLFADDRGYIFDSSIGVDHLISYAGSVFPYNIPVARDSYYKTLNLLEICPMQNDDINYFIKSEEDENYDDQMQRNDALLFEKYLIDFFDHAVQKNNGLMVYAGNPEFTGYSDITTQPLKKIIDLLKSKNCWFTTVEEIARYRNQLKDLKVAYSWSGDGNKNVNLKISLPDQTSITGLSFKTDTKPEYIDTKCNYNLKEVNGINYLIVDVKNGDEISLSFK